MYSHLNTVEIFGRVDGEFPSARPLKFRQGYSD